MQFTISGYLNQQLKTKKRARFPQEETIGGSRRFEWKEPTNRAKL